MESLRSDVKQFTLTYLRQDYKEQADKGDLIVNVARLDSRLRLAACQENISLKLQKPSHGIRNMTVKTSCNAGKQWTIYVPVSVDVFEDVLVASRTLSRGDILTMADLNTARINTARSNGRILYDKKRVLGLEVSRSLNPGEPIKLSHLRKADVVKKGDVVLLKASSNGLSVATSGTALGTGAIGAMIRVQNDASKRIVDAMVTGPGKVSVGSLY